MPTEPSSSIPFSLRPAQAEDEAFLFLLFAESQPQLDLLRPNETLWRSLIDVQYRGRKMTYDQLYPGAENSILCWRDAAGAAHPVGRILVYQQPGRWRIIDIAVLAAQRGKGIGAWALKACMAESAAAGARLELRVTFGNPARRLYERLGFTVVSEEGMDVEMAYSCKEPMHVANESE